MFVLIFFCKQKTAYEIRISDGSSDVCSSDLLRTYPWRLCRRTHFCWIFTTPIPLQPMAGGFPSGSPRRSSKRRALSIGDTALRDRRGIATVTKGTHRPRRGLRTSSRRRRAQHLPAPRRRLRTAWPDRKGLVEEKRGTVRVD